jgi:hypothetical protein
MTDRTVLSPPERRELQRMSRSRSARDEDVRRANILLSLASGAYSLREISRSPHLTFLDGRRNAHARFFLQASYGLPAFIVP